MKLLSSIWFTFLLFALLTRAAHAGGPENVMLVVNANSQDSIAIANHYVQLRNIPANNVVYLDDVPETLTCTAEQFREKILVPILKQIEARNLARQIEYIVYSAGFPTTVKIDEQVEALKSKIPEFNANVWLPKASINSLTYHYQEFLGNSPSYLAMDANWYARRIVRNMLEVPFVGKLQKKYQAAIENYRAKKYESAAQAFAGILKDHPRQIAVRYYLARSLAQQGKQDEALKELELCVRSGWCYRSLTENDNAFSDLKNLPRFTKILQATPDLVYGLLPTRGFEGNIFWGRNGWDNGDRSEGKQFVLSTVLGVTAGRGNTREQVIANLERSRAADGRNPDGTFFFARTSDVRSTTRQPQFPRALKELRRLGFRAEMTPEAMPKNRDHVLGVTLGAPRLDWSTTGSRFEPGALADNLTSFGGILAAKASQTPLTDFLAQGAAGASGTVVEPLSIPNKFPDANLHVHYAKGCTLAESFYQSVQAPFQLLIVGDPLCAPWAKFPEFSVAGLTDGQQLTADFFLEMTPDKDSPAIRHFEIFLDGIKGNRTIAPGEKLKIGLKSLTDGYHEIRIVALDKTMIRTKASQTIGFEVNATGKYVNLAATGNDKYQLSRTITLEAETNVGDQIEIYQNSRSLGSISGQKGSLTLDCSLLGQGPSRLQAVVMDGGKRISSPPLEVEIIP
ncbi:MAG: hypothetical protein GY819_15545 [Planctomycetaceae bacterium]|nr:hypothetical protein [Planctomycetaceae bacterium]MCP4464205.1 hypothetical protein [Planctomycetaceae bacterium]MDG1808294.1 hypothetical protein [Pirellulaceae bacterium]